MAYTNIEEAILAKLDSASWTLAGRLVRANIHFTTGWYDAHKSEYPQVSVSYLFPYSDSEMFFGNAADDDNLHTIDREIVAVNCWLRVPAGKSVNDFIDDIEQMRVECYKILKDQWKNYAAPANVGAVIPRNRGTPFYPTEKQPRMLRVEIEVQVNIRE